MEGINVSRDVAVLDNNLVLIHLLPPNPAKTSPQKIKEFLDSASLMPTVLGRQTCERININPIFSSFLFFFKNKIVHMNPKYLSSH